MRKLLMEEIMMKKMLLFVIMMTAAIIITACMSTEKENAQKTDKKKESEELEVMSFDKDRETFTNEAPADYAMFNSITNNAGVGDERNFVRVGELNSSDPYEDEIEVVPGKEYEVYIYFHNDAASDTNESGYGVATNTRIASAYPTELKSGERGMISAILSWSFVTPDSPDDPTTGEVWDEAYFTTKSDSVVLRYKVGSATIHNAGKADGSVLPSSLFTEKGTLIGFNKLAGTIPGCAEYSGYITYTLIAEKTESSLSLKASVDGENWADSVSVKPGDFVTYSVEFNNTGNTDLSNVIFKESHNAGLSLRSGSTTVFDYNHPDGIAIDDILDLSGYNTGDASPGALIQLSFQAQVADDETLNGKVLENTISVSYNSEEQQSDTVQVHVSKE